MHVPCEFPLAPLTRPPSKLCPQCRAIVPLRQKLYNSCKHVFQAKQIVMQSLEQNRKRKASVRAAEYRSCLSFKRKVDASSPILGH